MTTKLQLNRRALLTTGAAAGLFPLLHRSALADACTMALTTVKGKPDRAVSLKEVSQLMAAGKPARLEGLTRLDGYVVDRENRDIILFGGVERGQPELQPADFIVTLRSAYGRGDVYRKSAAISIDTDPEHYRRVEGLPITNPDGRRRYQELCALSDMRKVRVDGMPRHCRVAKILLDADIKMKQVAQGRAKLPISTPFPGDFDALIADWRAQLTRGGKDDFRSGVTRYWFMPGRFSHGEAKDAKNMVRFNHTQVVLKTEDETASADGKSHVPTGRLDPYAQAFTCAWSTRMEEIYKSEMLWQEMRNMYRHFALTRIMADLGAIKHADFDAEFFLDRFDIPNVPVPDTTPGGSRVEVYVQHHRSGSTTFARSVCGGVDVGFNKPIEKLPDPEGDILFAARNVLGSRPSPTHVAWDVTPGKLKDIVDTPSTPVSRPSPEPGGSPSLKELFKGPGAAPSPPPAAPAAPTKPRSLQDLFKT